MNDKKKTLSENRVKKEGIVGEVTEKVNKAKAMVFTDYTGLTHKQLEGFKRELKKADAEYVVAKNTLLKIALGDKAEGQDDKFVQPTGTMFVYGDVVAPLKALSKMVKDMEKPQIKFGWMESSSGGKGQVLSDKDVLKIATLPSREVLIAQMLGMMKSPIQGFHRALSWNLQKFVLTLAAIEKQKS